MSILHNKYWIIKAYILSVSEDDNIRIIEKEIKAFTSFYIIHFYNKLVFCKINNR